jgi:hypothetical protein
MSQNNRKTIAIFSNVPIWIERHPEALDLAWQIHGSNMNLIWIICDRALKSCPANPNHSLFLCGVCLSQSRRTERKLLPPNTAVIRYSGFDSKGEDLTYPSSWIELLNFQYSKMPIGSLVASQISDDLSDISCSDELVQTRGKELIDTGVSLYEWSLQLISDHKIDHVYAWNGRRPSDGPLLYAARESGIAFSSFISDEPGTLRVEAELYVQTNKSYMSNYNQSLPVDTSERDHESVKRFFDKQRFGVGADKYFQRFGASNSQRFIKPTSKKKVLAIFTSSIWETIGIKDMSLTQHLNPFDEFSRIHQICRDTEINAQWHVVVRFHPNQINAGPMETEQIDQLINCSDSTQFILPNSNISSYDLLDAADLVLTFGSTIGIESAWNNKPTLLFGRASYEDAGFCHRYTDFESLKQALQNDSFTPPDTHLVERYVLAVQKSNTQYQYVRRGKFGSVLGSTHIDRFRWFQLLLNLARRIRYTP